MLQSVRFRISTLINHNLILFGLRENYQMIPTSTHDVGKIVNPGFKIITGSLNHKKVNFFGGNTIRMLSTSIPPTSQPQNPKDPNEKSSYYESYKKTINDTFESYTTNYQNLKNDIIFITEQFEQKRYNTNKLKILVICVSGFTLFLLWRTIKSFISHETSDVAIRTMNDEEFKKNMYLLLDQIIDYSKTDPNAQKKIMELLQISLKNALDDKEIMVYLNKIVSEVVLSEQTQKDIEKLTKDIIRTQLTDDENKILLTQTLHQSTTEVYNKVTEDIGNKFKFWKR